MQTDAYSSPEKKRVALIGIPDDALDVLNHYTQSPEWEAAVVVSESYEDYAVRMAEILGVPVASAVDRDLLISCDLVIVGENVSLAVDEVRALLEGTGTEVATVDEVTGTLGILPFQEEEGEAETVDLAPEDIDSAFEGIGLPREQAEAAVATGWASDEDPAEIASQETFEPIPEYTESIPAPEEEPVTDEEPESAAEVGSDPEPPTDSEGTADLESEDAMEPPAPVEPTPPADAPASAYSTRTLAAVKILPIDGKHEGLRTILEAVLARTAAKTGSLMVPEPDGDRLRFAAAIGLPAEIVAETKPRMGEGLAGKAFATGESQVLRAEIPDLAEVGTSVRHRLAASVPIARDGRVLAVLSVNVESSRPIDEDAILAALRAETPNALNAVLAAVDLPRLDLDTRRGFLLARLDEIMGTADPFPARLREVSDLLRRGVGADYAHVYLVDPLSRRLELVTSTDGLSAGIGRLLSLDRGFLGWIARTQRCALVTVPDPDSRTERAFAGLPVHAGGPYALILLEHFEVRPGERERIEDLLLGVLRQLEEIFEVERGVESQDVLSGLKMRIADRSSQLEILPAELRAQAALEFAIQILAAEAAVWLPGPDLHPVIAQPQTRQAARIVADVWDELETVAAWVRGEGATAQGGKGMGWDTDGPPGPSPYVGVKDARGDGVILAFFAPGEAGGPTVQLPARILLEALASVAALIPVEASEHPAVEAGGAVDRKALDRMVVHETRRAQRSGRFFALTRFELEGKATEEDLDGLRRFLLTHKRVVDVFSEIEPGAFVMLSPDTDPGEDGLRERYLGLWEEEGASRPLVVGRCAFPYYERSTGYPKLVTETHPERKAA